MLKRVLENLDGLAAEVAALYKKGEDGKYHLDLEGGDDVSGLKKNNAELLNEKKKLQDEKKKLEEQMALYKDLGDPEKAKEALAKIRKIEEEKLIAEGDIDKIVTKRTEAMRQDFAAQSKALSDANDKLTAENGKLKTHLNQVVIERGVLDACGRVGQLRKEAVVDIISRGNQTWSLDEEGHPVPKNPDGTTIYGKDGKAPMTMDEWASLQIEAAPHLWMPSKGGGGLGSGNGPDGTKMTSEELSKLSPMAKARYATQNGLRKTAA